MWGNAYRNPDRSLLMKHLKCVRDEAGNAFCKRTYKLESEVAACTKDFEEVCDDVKEYLSKVPNLYVEDGDAHPQCHERPCDCPGDEKSPRSFIM